MVAPEYDSAPPDVGGFPGEAAEHARAWVGNILETAAIWYALLYLVQIEGRDDFEFEFQRVTEHLSVAFLHYITFAAHKEWANLGERYYIRGAAPLDWDREEVERHLRFARDLRGIPRFYTTSRPQAGWDLPIANPADVFHFLHENGAFDPTARCADVALAFEQTPGGGPEAMMEAEGGTGWLPQFNGPAWTAIARHGRDWEDPTRVAWVDQTFSIEHNNGNFVDKIQPDIDRRKTIGDDVYNSSFLSVHEYQDAYLTALLDQNHAGNIRFVFSVASRIDRAFGLGFGFERAYTEIGQPDGSLYPTPTKLRRATINNRTV